MPLLAADNPLTRVRLGAGRADVFDRHTRIASAVLILLHRYILTDLLKVFALTTLVLVTVIAFGATIKPLSDGGILAAGEAVQYLGLAMVSMLQFALPFAAGFASTIILHRMTSENEILAAAASGISYRRLLTPIIGLGLGLTLLMVLLTQSVIPRFWSQMERVIAEDVARLLQHRIESGVPAEFGNVQIYADDLRIISQPRDTDADVRFVLLRAAVVELDSEGRIRADGTASQAIVDLHRRFGETYLKFATSEGGAYDARSGQRGGWSGGVRPGAIVIQNLLRDQTRAMTRSELIALHRRPELSFKVCEDMEALSRELATVETAAAIDRGILERGQIELHQQALEQRRYVIHAEGYRDGRLIAEDGSPVFIQQYEGATLMRRLLAEEAYLVRNVSSEGAPLFDLEMLNVEVTDLQAGGVTNRRARLTDKKLALANASLTIQGEDSAAVLLERAHASGGPEKVINSLEQRIESLRREITSRSLSRYAQSVTAALLLVFGATLAMLLRGSLPLVVYIWAFLPSVLNLIMISGGDKMMRDGEIVPGLAVMWGGNALLAILFLAAYWRLSKN